MKRPSVYARWSFLAVGPYDLHWRRDTPSDPPAGRSLADTNNPSTAPTPQARPEGTERRPRG